MSSQIFCAGRSFAEFAPQGAKKFKSIFRTDMCRTENNYHRASVQAKRVRGGAMQRKSLKHLRLSEIRLL